MDSPPRKAPTLVQALVPVGVLIGLLAASVYLFGDGLYRSNPIHGADLAVVCVEAIASRDRELEAGGPETLTHEKIAQTAFASLGKSPRITCIPDWLRKFILRSLQSFTTQKIHGPVEFFLTVMAMDMIAPEYGSRTLEKFYSELSAQAREE